MLLIMENFKKDHWDKVFLTKQETEVSWYEPKPETSIHFFIENNIPKDAKSLMLVAEIAI